MFQKQYKTYEIRKALDIYSRTQSFRKAEKICGVGKSTIQRWWVSFHQLVIRNHLQRKKAKRRRNAKFRDIEGYIQQIFQSPKLEFLSLKQIQNKLPYSKPPCLSWLSTVLKKSRISRRRFSHTTVYPNNPSRMKELYEKFRVSLHSLEPENIVCLDETAFSNFGNTSYGYFTRGKQPQTFHIPKREKVSLVMAIHPYQGIIAVAKQPTAFNKDSFIVFLKDTLLPSLSSNTKAILMDNIRFHHSKEVMALLEERGVAPLFIPPYSPRCNPIEEVFSQMKRIYRRLDLTNKGSFQEKIQAATEELKLFKDMSQYYKHARRHVEETCRTYEL